jgi:hypothetical protein
LPEPEHAPDQEYVVMADPPVAFGDHVQVSCPEVGLLGALIVGAAGIEVATRLEDPAPLVPIAFVAVTLRV